MQEIVHLLEPGTTTVDLEQIAQVTEITLKATVGAEAGLTFTGAADAVRRKLAYDREEYQEFAEQVEKNFEHRYHQSVAANFYDAFRHPVRRGRETTTKAIMYGQE